LKKYLSSYWIRSAVFTFLQRFSLTFFGFVNFIILIRGLSKPQMGLWAFFLVVTTLFETTKSYLLKNAHIKFVGNSNTEKTAIASSSFLINATITGLFILFLFLFSGSLSYWLGAGNELEQMLKWYIPAMVFLIFFSHFEAVSQSHLDFKSVFAGYFSRQVLFFAIILMHAVFKIPFSLVQIVIYQSISTLVGTLVIFLYSKKHLQYVFNPSIQWIKKILGFGGYILGSGIATNIFANLDQLMIAKFTSSKIMVANYNAATRISALVDIPSYSAAEILLPKVSQVDISEGYGKVKYMYERMVGILLCFTTPIAISIFFFPKFVIGVIAGAQYQDSSFILQMYMLSCLIRPVQNQAANILLYIGKARLCFFLNLIFLGVNFGVNCLLLFKVGAYGAAIGNVISAVLSTLVWYVVLQKTIAVKYTNIAKYTLDTYKAIYSKAVIFIKRKQPETIL
jgi:lipopolysaccharide exporter